MVYLLILTFIIGIGQKVVLADRGEEKNNPVMLGK